MYTETENLLEYCYSRDRLFNIWEGLFGRTYVLHSIANEHISGLKINRIGNTLHWPLLFIKN